MKENRKAMKKDKNKRKLYVADFETTVDKDPSNQTETEVWSAAICEVLKRPEPQDVTVYNNIFQFVEHIEKLDDESIVFFHNAKFDLSFLLNELNREGYVQAFDPMDPTHYMQDKQQKKAQYSYKLSISNMGQWYGCRITFVDKTIEIRDSLKKLPFDLRTIGKSFATKYQKTEMEYDAPYHKAFGYISDEEMEYIKNDVLVLSEALYIIWYDFKMTGVTIGSDCLKEFKDLTFGYNTLFPDMTKINLKDSGGPDINVYEYCVKAYSGGWCWKNPVADKKVFYADKNYSDEIKAKLDNMYMNESTLTKVKHMLVVDVNSLYPSVMIDSDKTEGYPVGKPTYATGEPTKHEEDNMAIFRRFKCRFILKKGKLPFLHIRNTPGYDANECLTSSVDAIGNDELREYTMTQPEWELFNKHYELIDYEPIDYLVFARLKGIFDIYINKYRDMKIKASKEGNKAMRQIAKLFLNNLYGKLATSTCSSYKTIYFEDDVMKFESHTEYAKDPVYIPAGAYVTAYARRFTISAGQLNYFEGQNKGVMYSDTDSLHIVDMTPDELQGIPFDDTAFLCWACEESSVALATYAKQKTYIEVSTEEDFKTVTDKNGNEDIAFIIKAAGLGKAGKEYFKECLDLTENVVENGEIVKAKMFLEYFREGLRLPNVNLKTRQIKGGILLTPGDFKIN